MLTEVPVAVLYESVTRDSQNGTVYLKLVNMAGEVQPLHVTFNGDSGQRNAIAVVLTSHNPQDTNTLSEPTKVVPVTVGMGSLNESFVYKLPPYSVTVLRLSNQDDRKGRDYDESAGRQGHNQD